MSQLISMLMSRIHRQRKIFLALFLIAISAVAFKTTHSANAQLAMPVLKPTNVKLEYLGKDKYGYNYRVVVLVKNTGADMTAKNTTTTPAVMLNVNDSSGYGTAETKIPMLPAGGEYTVAYSASVPVKAFPGGVQPPLDFRGLPGASLIIPTSTPYLYVTAGIMPDAHWAYDNSLYKTITKNFEIKTGGKAVESAPDFKVVDVKIIPVATGTNPGQRYYAEVKVVNAGGPAHHVFDLKGYPDAPDDGNLNEEGVIVGLRITDRNKVQTGYLGQIKGPVIESGDTQKLRFLLPANANTMAGYSVKAMVNYGFRNDFVFPVVAGAVNNSVKAGIDQQPTIANPFIRYTESSYNNNYWVGYPTVPKPDLIAVAPRLVFVNNKDAALRKYYAVSYVANKGAAVYIGSSTVKVAFRISFVVGNKASSTSAVGYLRSKTGWLNKGSLGEVKADLTNVFKNYKSRNSFRITQHVVKIDASTVSDATKGLLIESNDANNTAASKQ